MSDNLCVKIWNDCLAFIKDNIKPEQYEALFAPIVPLSLEGEMLVLGVPSHAVVEYIEAHFLDLLRITLEKFIGKDADLSYKVQVDRTNNIDMEIAGTRKSADLPVGNLDAEGYALVAEFALSHPLHLLAVTNFVLAFTSIKYVSR